MIRSAMASGKLSDCCGQGTPAISDVGEPAGDTYGWDGVTDGVAVEPVVFGLVGFVVACVGFAIAPTVLVGEAATAKRTETNVVGLKVSATASPASLTPPNADLPKDRRQTLDNPPRTRPGDVRRILSVCQKRAGSETWSAGSKLGNEVNLVDFMKNKAGLKTMLNEMQDTFELHGKETQGMLDKLRANLDGGPGASRR